MHQLILSQINKKQAGVVLLCHDLSVHQLLRASSADFYKVALSCLSVEVYAFLKFFLFFYYYYYQ